MRVSVALISILSSMLAACATPAPATPTPAAPALEASNAVVELPFEIASNKPWVQVRIDDSKPQWFILDTGCLGRSIIARACAQRLHLRLGDETKASGVGAGEGVELALNSTHDVTLSVGGVAMHCAELGVFPLDHVEPYEGRALDGLLGEDFMREHVVEIDYAQHKIRLHDPATFVFGGQTAAIPITFHEGLVVAEGAMTPPRKSAIPCHVVIDTGVRTTIVWYHPFVLTRDLLATQPRLVTGTIGGGAGGETKGDIGRLENMKIGTITIPNPTVVFSRDTTGVFAGSDEDGIVGGEILRQCRVTFDYPHERLYLEPYAGAFTSFDGDMSGLFLVSPGPAFQRVMIQSVAAGTPAADAGLSKGDEIVAIDEHSIAGRTLDEVRDLFKKPGATYHLGVKRGDDERAVILKLRPLV